VDWLDALVRVGSLFGRVPTVAVNSYHPLYTSLPKAWLAAAETKAPPLLSYVNIDNFGSNRVKEIVIKLALPEPDYPIECRGLPGSSWRHDTASNEIRIEGIDPKGSATFEFFYDHPPAHWSKPRTLVEGRLIGWPSDWLGTVHAMPPGLLLLMVTALLGSAGVLGYSFTALAGPEERMRQEYFDAYANSHGLAACHPRTLRAKDGTVNAAEISRHAAGIGGALAYNQSPSLDELLRRQTVFICRPSEK
jgi:hypothetical protein